MNKLNFNQSVGFPLETEILDEMQKAWSVFNALGAIVGNFSIISGCNTVGTNVTDGVVFINGEVLEFKGGLAQNNVIIVEVPQALEFEDSNSHDVIYTRYATFGVATTQWLWSSFKRGFETKQIPEALGLKEDKTTVTALLARIVALEARPTNGIPVGLVALWKRPANEIPDGWQEYTGLAGRTPVGFSSADVDFDVVGKTGGNKKVKLTAANIPELQVKLKKSSSTSGGIADNFVVNISNNAGETTLTVNEDSANTDVNIMNPFKIVHFIEYIG